MGAMLSQLLADQSLWALADAVSPEPLFPEQQRALAETGLLRGASALITMPTGSGKTRVADAAMLAPLGAGRTVLCLVPTRTLARERAAALGRSLGPLGYRVACSTRDDRSDDDAIRLGAASLIVATYEKGRALVLQSPMLAESLGLLAVDEWHLTLDPDRGPGLLSLVLGLRALHPALPIVATTSLAMPSRYVQLPIFQSSVRQQPLNLAILNTATGDIAWSNADGIGPFWPARDTSELAGLLDSLPKPILFYAPTKVEAVRLAGELAALRPANRPRPEFGDTPFSHLVADWLACGVGMHSTDLDTNQRLAVERALRTGAVDVCFTCGTLNEGINCGVRTVVALTPQWGTAPLSNLFGRAGRPKSGPGLGLLLIGSEAELPAARAAFSTEKIANRELACDQDQALACIAFQLALRGAQPEDELKSLLEDFCGAAWEAAVARGMALGYWTGGPVLIPTELCRMLALHNIEPDTLAGWRTLLRRFPKGATEAALLFLAFGAKAICHAVRLGKTERQSGRWIGQLLSELDREDGALARYLSGFLEDVDALPKRHHEAAKATAFWLAMREGLAPDAIEREFGLPPGQVEELTDLCDYHIALIGKLCQGNLPAIPHRETRVISIAPAVDDPIEPVIVITVPANGTVEVGGKRISMTPHQCRLLEVLCRDAEETVPYEYLEREVWPENKVHRQQVSYHKRRVERLLQDALGTNVELIEAVAAHGLRLKVAKNRVAFREGVGAPSVFREGPPPHDCHQEVQPIPC